MVRAHFCSLPQRRSAAVYLFSAVQFSCPNASRLPPPIHDLPSQDIRPNGCCSPHGVSAALVTSLRLQCRPQRVLPLFLQNCRLTVSGRYGAQPHVVTEHVIHLSVRHLPNYCILYTPYAFPSLVNGGARQKLPKPAKKQDRDAPAVRPCPVFRKETFRCYLIICALTPPGTSVRQRSYPPRRSASRSRRTRSCRCAGTPCARRGPRRSS